MRAEPAPPAAADAAAAWLRLQTRSPSATRTVGTDVGYRTSAGS